MKQFVGGVLLGIGIGLLVCGLLTGSIVTDFETKIAKYDRHINDFYEFTHSYGFETIRGLVNQSASFYKTNPLLRQALETFGMGELGQLFEDVDDNFEEVVDISEDLYDARTTVREARSLITYLMGGGILLIGVGIVLGVWSSREK